jgi:hypothetical protein
MPLDMEDSTPTPTAVPPAIREQLERTQPWLRFLGIMMWIGIVLMVLASVGFIVMGIVGLAKPDKIKDGAMLIGLGVFYLFLVGFYIFPAIFTLRSAKHIRQLTAQGNLDDAVAALDNQRKLWKFMGIFTIVIFALYALAIVAAILLPAIATIQKGSHH